MPIQENEQKKSEPIQPSQEESLKKNIAKSQENSEHSFLKLLPILNMKAEFHQSRMDTLDEKIATRQDKIAKNGAKIEKLSAKADRLEDKNKVLKATLGNIPGVKQIIETNERKIQEIREEKIPKRQEKCAVHKERIQALTNKRDVVSHKLDRVLALNDAVRSFSIGFNKERREVFSDAMDKLNQASVSCLNDKKNSLEIRKAELMQTYSLPETSAVDKVNLQGKINDVNGRLETIENKIHKIARPENFFAEQSNDMVDAAMKVTEDKLAEMTEKGKLRIPDIADSVITEAQALESKDKSEIAHIADNYLKNTEMAVEDDYNSIDGIINNGSKEDLLQKRDELSASIESMKPLADNSLVSEEMRETTKANIANLESKLNAVNAALAVFITPVEKAAEKSVITNDKDSTVKINPEFYKALPKENRHIEVMAASQANLVMDKLENAGIAFSAVKRNENKTAVTVDKSNADALKNAMRESFKEMELQSQAAWHQLGDAYVEAYEERKSPDLSDKKPPVKSINSDYFKSLTKENRSISVETAEIGKKVMEQLEDRGIQYSAVERKNNSVAITVAKEDKKAYKDISDTMKSERAVQYVNPEFYKSIPKNERSTQHMSQKQAEEKVTELSQKGIPHSAVLNGDKSAVTIEKKNTKVAYMSRETLKREAQRISRKGRETNQTKSKNQGLEQ